MKKTYIQPMLEVTEVAASQVIMTSLSFGEDITTGNTGADAPAFNDFIFFDE